MATLTLTHLERCRKTFTAKNVLLHAVALTGKYSVLHMIEVYCSDKGTVRYPCTLTFLEGPADEDINYYEFRLSFDYKFLLYMGGVDVNKELETMVETWAQMISSKYPGFECTVNLIQRDKYVLDSFNFEVPYGFPLDEVFGPSQFMSPKHRSETEQSQLLPSMLKYYYLHTENEDSFDWAQMDAMGYELVNSAFNQRIDKGLSEWDARATNVQETMVRNLQWLVKEGISHLSEDNDGIDVEGTAEIFDDVGRDRLLNAYVHQIETNKHLNHKRYLTKDILYMVHQDLESKELLLLYLEDLNLDKPEEGVRYAKVFAILNPEYESTDLNSLLKEKGFSSRIIERMSSKEKIDALSKDAPKNKTIGVTEMTQGEFDTLVEYVVGQGITGMSRSILTTYSPKRLATVAGCLLYPGLSAGAIRESCYIQRILKSFDVHGSFHLSQLYDNSEESIKLFIDERNDSELESNYSEFVEDIQDDYKNFDTDKIRRKVADFYSDGESRYDHYLSVDSSSLVELPSELDGVTKFVGEYFLLRDEALELLQRMGFTKSFCRDVKTSTIQLILDKTCIPFLVQDFSTDDVASASDDEAVEDDSANIGIDALSVDEMTHEQLYASCLIYGLTTIEKLKTLDVSDVVLYLEDFEEDVKEAEDEEVPDLEDMTETELLDLAVEQELVSEARSKFLTTSEVLDLIAEHYGVEEDGDEEDDEDEDEYENEDLSVNKVIMYLSTFKIPYLNSVGLSTLDNGTLFELYRTVKELTGHETDGDTLSTESDEIITYDTNKSTPAGVTTMRLRLFKQNILTGEQLAVMTDAQIVEIDSNLDKI